MTNALSRESSRFCPREQICVVNHFRIAAGKWPYLMQVACSKKISKLISNWFIFKLARKKLREAVKRTLGVH